MMAIWHNLPRGQRRAASDGESDGNRQPACLETKCAMTVTPAPVAVVLASDHAGFDLKALLADWLHMQGHPIIDLGPDDTASVDYPDYGYALAEAIARGDAHFGLAICGSGIGISIAVNRHSACRCALVSEPVSAQFARAHNDANVLALGSRLIGVEMAKACVTAFLSTPFVERRHAQRIAKLGRYKPLEETI
jgi:ribose 5-phosphate isomerase B